MTMRIGWLGTGRMGLAMAKRLLDAGHDVTVWNRTASKATALVEAGAKAAETKADLAQCDLVFTMVNTSDDLHEVILGPEGLLSSQHRPRVIVDCSTVSGDASRQMRLELEKLDIHFIGAPVSGNPSIVTAGQSCIVGSGPAAGWTLAEAAMKDIAGTLVYAGAEDQSRLVKLCHNLFLGMTVQALVEVLTVVEKGGTDRAAFMDFINGTVISSPWIANRTNAIKARDWTPTFTMELLRKDFDLGVGAARELEVPVPIATSVHQLIQAALGSGWTGVDFLALYEQQARNAGLVDEVTA
jgi:3-hydroxyisobutyrate dehydrogenase-like beta-hydroxyacid dehydrogenase